MTAVTRQLLVDWNGDGVVGPPGQREDVTADLRQPAATTFRYGRDQIRELSPLAAGRAQFVLDNQALVYSQDNASSPLYGQVVPNRLVVARATATLPVGYRQTVLDDAPVGYWRLGESSGTTANDASGNGNNGAYTADPLNLIANPSAEVDASGYNTYNGTTTRVTTTAKFGSASLKHVRSFAGAAGGPFFDGRSTGTYPIPVVAGLPYTFSVYARLDVPGSQSFRARIEFYDDAGVPKGSVDGTYTPLNTTDWSQRFSVTATAPAGSTKAVPAFYWTSDPGAGFTFYTDGWQFEQATNASSGPSAYTDGSQTNCAWTGTPNASTSKRLPTLGTAGLLAAEPNGGSDTAVRFLNSYVTVPDSASLVFTAGFSLEAWFVLDALPTQAAMILAKGGEFLLRVDAASEGNKLSASVIIGGGAEPRASWATVPTPGVAYHVCATWDGTTLRLYVNGSQVASQARSGSVTNTTNQVIVGNDGVGSTFPGVIDEVAVYNTALSAARVLAHYQAGLDQTKGDQAAATYGLFRGFLTQPDEHGMRQDQTVAFQAVDVLGAFNARTVETAMLTNARSDQAIAAVLDALGWPSGSRVLDTGAATFARWWASGVTGFEAIRQIVLSEGPPAVAYVDPDTGAFHFEGRRYRLLTGRCLSSQAVLRDTGTEPCYSRSDPSTPAENIVNSCTVNVRSYTPTAGQALVVGGPPLPLTLPPGGSAEFPVTTTADAFDAAVPSVTYAAGSGAASLDRTSGRTATLTVTAGGAGCTISAVAVTATTYAISVTPVSNTIDASASIARYGERPLPGDYQPVWLSDRATAVAFCDYVVSRYQDRVKQNVLALNNLDPRRLAQGLARRVSDRVTVVESRTGESADYFVEQVTWQWLPGGGVEANLGVERALPQAYWRLGIAGLSELGLATRLSF